ncbi:MAG TPA: DNA alkylation repair protein [Pyrinomonadaceae bacterium]
MPTTNRVASKATKKKPKSLRTKTPNNSDIDVEEVISKLKRLGTKKTREAMTRYAIPNDKAFGVSVGALRDLGKKLGRNHDLALALWKTGWYEARMLAAFVDEPEQVTPAQMDRWCRDFDNWAIVDTVCFHLFDKTPHAFRKVEQWSDRRAEFEKRAAFALLASLGVHDKRASDESFAKCLSLIEQAATDERNFVKKGVSWALRVIGRRSKSLNRAAVALSEKLCTSEKSSARWIGRDALRELTSSAVVRRLK